MPNVASGRRYSNRKPGHPPKATARDQHIVTADEVRLERARRQAARERLIPFSEYLWPPTPKGGGFQTRPYRELMAGAFELLETRQITRLMTFAPSQFGKSTLGTKDYPAWYMGRNPDDAQILCSYNADLAYSFSFEVRQRVASPAFRALFGDMSPYELPVELSEERAATKEWLLQYHRGRMKAAGVGGGISGFAADQVLIDDPVKDDNHITSPAIQERHIRWYNGQVYGRLSPKGVIAITMTRWHENDLCGHLLRRQEDDGDLWHILRLTALAESPAQIREWCERNFVTVDRLIVADMIPGLKPVRGYS